MINLVKSRIFIIFAELRRHHEKPIRIHRFFNSGHRLLPAYINMTYQLGINNDPPQRNQRDGQYILLCFFHIFHLLLVKGALEK